MMATARHAMMLALAAVVVGEHMQTVGPSHHVGLRKRSQQRMRRSEPRAVDIGDDNITIVVQQPQDCLCFRDAVCAELGESETEVS